MSGVIAVTMGFLRRDRSDAVASFDRRCQPGPGTRLRVRPGRFQVGIEVQPDGAVVTAWLQVDPEPGAQHYEVVAAGFNDPSHYGNQPIRARFTPTEPAAWVAHDQHYRWAASVWRGPAEGVRDAVAWMHRRFAGMRVRVTVRCALTAPGTAPTDPARGDA